MPKHMPKHMPMPMPMPRPAGPAGPAPSVAGALLTGGQSRRMGFDKAAMPVAGQANATRLAAVMAQALGGPLVEVGPGWSGLTAVTESPLQGGPLVALACGYRHLADEHGWKGPLMALACDLPLLGAGTLSVLAAWPGSGSVVPVHGGQPQPLCARWAASDLELAWELVGQGSRSMRALLAATAVELVGPSDWPHGWRPAELADVDTPEDLGRLGL